MTDMPFLTYSTFISSYFTFVFRMIFLPFHYSLISFLFRRIRHFLLKNDLPCLFIVFFFLTHSKLDFD